MKKLTKVQKAIALPLVGEIWGWLFFVAAIFANQIQDNLEYQVFQETETVRIGTYLFLVAIAGFSLTAVWGNSLAIKARAELGDSNSLARASQRFTTLAIVIALTFGALFAISNFFMGAFDYFSGTMPNVVVRILNVYLPILLAAALVVFVILRAFVFREGEHRDGEKDKRGLTETQKALGLGYAIPIIATAFAIILGLIIFDFVNTTLQGWVWVLIQLIVVGGVIQGTRFASKAKQGVARPPRERGGLTAGASALNFVLSIIFGGIVSIMAFTNGGAAIGSLQRYPDYNANGEVIGPDKLTTAPITATWVINEILPALILLALAVIGTYWTIWARNAGPASLRATSSE